MAKCNRIPPGTVTGLVGVAATTVLLAALGRSQEGSAWGPFNAISHMFFGKKAAQIEGFAAKESLSGLGLHAGSVAGWCALYEAAAGRVPFPGSLAIGTGVTGLIWLFDYKVVPERLRPGFEKRLGGGGVAAAYALLALTLGLSPLWKRDAGSRVGGGRGGSGGEIAAKEEDANHG